MDGFGREILAGTCFPGEQDGGRRARGDPCQQCFHLPHRRRLADDRVEAEFAFLVAPQCAHFAAQLAGFQRLLDEQRHFIEMERLVDVVIRAELHRLDGALDRRARSSG